MTLMFERIESVGLSHYSYLLAAAGAAIVIDPRRDVDVYVDRARTHGLRITDVLETHRHEDFVTGSAELAERTGARIWRTGAELPYRYGEPVEDGRSWHLGERTLTALATPGHTPGHTAYVLSEEGVPTMLFSGDAVFAGELGRTDLGGKDRVEEATERLHASVAGRILTLGDGVVLCPAHGGGSACGAAIVDRPWTSIGLEWRLDPKLSLPRDEFVTRHAEESRSLPTPPYFSHVHALNLDPPVLGRMPEPAPLAPGELARRAEDGAQVLDVRALGCFAAGHVPGSLSIQLDEIGAWAGWLLDPARDVLLVTETADTAPAVTQLVRMGFDRMTGALAAGGVLGWLESGMPGRTYGTPDARTLLARLTEGPGERRPHVLDVRTDEELRKVGWIEGARHIPLHELPRRLDEVPRDRPVTTVCGTGVRSMTAASLLERAGSDRLDVLYGGMTAWSALGLPVARDRRHAEAGVPR